MVCIPPKTSIGQERKTYKDIIYKVILFVGIIGVWHVASSYYNSEMLCPSPTSVIKKFIFNLTDVSVMTNISITMGRVFKGFLCAMVIGVPLGLTMGLSKTADKLVGGLVDSIRQVPIMAWVPLTIIWFGIGDGPTIFLIAFSGIFPIILNTIQGVRNISPDYYHAARSMGGGHFSVFKDVVLPSTIPDILTGARLAISAGWM
ncbi:MAG: ABC transporter permease subunit SaoP, partial [Clostridium sp.]